MVTKDVEKMSKAQIAVRKHTLIESLTYHLMPGVFIGGVYYMIVPQIQAAGYPSVMALILTAIFILVPIQLGILFWHSKRCNNKLSLNGVVVYCSKLTWQQYVLWIPVIFITSGLLMTVFNPVSLLMQGWFPANQGIEMGLSDAFAKSKLIQTYALYFLWIVLLAPAVEELYFRGFLLPRMPEKLGRIAPIFHSLLFALYHVWSPWMVVARMFALLPLIYIVQWKKNVFLGIAAHWLINSIDFVMGVIFIASMA